MSAASIRSVLARVPRLCKRLHLSRGHLASCNAFRLQKRPQLPCLTASLFKADNGIPVLGKIRYGSMTCRSVWHSAAVPIREAMNVKPIAADIYADNAAMRYAKQSPDSSKLG